MSARPSEVLTRHVATFGGGGVEAAERLWHPDIEWRVLASDTAPIRGHDAMRRHYAEWTETIADLRGDVREILFEDDERVAAEIENCGRGRFSGVPAHGRYYVVCVIRDGLIVSVNEYPTREEALAALA